MFICAITVFVLHICSCAAVCCSFSDALCVHSLVVFVHCWRANVLGKARLKRGSNAPCSYVLLLYLCFTYAHAPRCVVHSVMRCAYIRWWYLCIVGVQMCKV